MNNEEPNIIGQIILTFFDDGQLHIINSPNMDLANQLVLLKAAYEQKLETLNFLLEKNEKGNFYS